MPDIDSILSRVSVLETEMKHLSAKMAERDKMNDEFMYRTDAALKKLLTQSDEWSGVRKLLVIEGTVIMAVAGVIGWILHELFPHGWRP